MKNIPLLLKSFLLAFLLLPWNQKQEFNNTLVIGELSGRTDSKSLCFVTETDTLSLDEAQERNFIRIVSNSNQEIVLELKDVLERSRQGPEKIIYRFFNSEWMLISALITEEIDFATLENEESAKEVRKSNPMIHVIPNLMSPHTVKMIGYNTKHPILKNQKVRQALSYAIDKELIVNKLLEKKADVARGPLSRDSRVFASGLEDYKYNPRKALQILRENGWEDRNQDGVLEDTEGEPLRFTLYYEMGLVLEENLVRWIKINWNEIGVDVIPKPYKKTEIKNSLRRDDFGTVVMSHHFTETIESFEDFFSSKGRDNLLGYYNPTLESYINFYKRIEEPDRKRTLLQAIQRVINQDQPVTFLYFKWLFFYLVNRNKFENYYDDQGNLKPYYQWHLKTPVKQIKPKQNEETKNKN